MKTGNLVITEKAALAPMAGVADRAFRELCRGYGAAYTVCEMASAKGISLGDKKSAELLSISEPERPAGSQIFGNSPETMAKAAEKLEIIKKGEFSDFEFDASVKSICDSLSTYYDSQNSLDLWYALKINNQNLYSPKDIAEKIKKITREDVILAAKGVKLHTVYKLLPKEGPIC